MRVFLLCLVLASQPGPSVPMVAFLDRGSCLDFARFIADEVVDDDASLECRGATVEVDEDREERGS